MSVYRLLRICKLLSISVPTATLYKYVAMKDIQETNVKSTLQVYGRRIELQNNFRERTLRAAKHNLQTCVPVSTKAQVKTQPALKKECKLKVNRIDEIEVCNAQIKKIHETKQVSELEKLLQIHTSNVHSTYESDESDIDVSLYGKLYEELFDQYYKELKRWDVCDEVL